MNLIGQLGLKKCQEIVDGAPESSFPVKWCLVREKYVRQVGFNTQHLVRGEWVDEFNINPWVDLETLRAAIADHNKCQHEWNETTSNGDKYRFFVCKHCDSTRNFIPLDEDITDYCSDIRNHIAPTTKVI